MKRSFSFFAVILTLSACGSTDGVYEPSCIAYEGDRIELRNGRFEWDRFTDEHRVDEGGNDIDAFPDFPKSGNYTLKDKRLTLLPDDGIQFGDWFLVEYTGLSYLLTGAQHEAFVSTSEIPNCALLRTSSNP